MTSAPSSWLQLQSQIEQTRYAIEHVATYEQARGALIAVFGISADDAATAMQNEVDREQIPLASVAERVLAEIVGRLAADPMHGLIRPAGQLPRSRGPV
jgi:AmiR/NasT family two-component response regulator